MPDVTIYGPAMSTHVRTARMTCVEKGVAHAREDVDFRSVAYRSLHPFNRVPAMRHGDFVLYETAAICRYIDRAFQGPPLQPTEAKALARMDQWMSAVLDYVFDIMVRELIWERLMVPTRGGQPDEAKIAAAVPKVAHQLAVFNAPLGAAPFLAGAALSLADLALFPPIFYLKLVPEGTAALAKVPALSAWFDRMAARPSAAATDPTRG
jgi:glutathione S-transferase